MISVGISTGDTETLHCTVRLQLFCHISWPDVSFDLAFKNTISGMHNNAE
jgi:hypothetical protein